MLAHGALLRKNFFTADELIAIVKDYRNAGLPEEDVAVMDFAWKVSLEPGSIQPEDIEELHRLGLKDEEILDVVSAAAARNFFSKALDALDAPPDEALLNMEPNLVQALIKGRPVEPQHLPG